MSILKVIIELLGLYLLYKLIFDFIIPVYETTKQVNKKMGEMQRNMNEHFNQSAGFREQSAGSGAQTQANTSTEKAAKPAKADYIEFEEVK